jgi:hypothetical protein
MSIPDKELQYLITNSKNDLSFYDKLSLNRFYGCVGMYMNTLYVYNGHFILIKCRK